jgi:hypothetical protein
VFIAAAASQIDRVQNGADFPRKADLHFLPNRERFMSGSEANRHRVLSLLNTERELILEQYRYIDIESTAVARGKPPMSETRQIPFCDRHNRIELNDFRFRSL